MEYKPEFPSKAQRIEWMNQGLCKDCGRPVDHPDRFVRCKTCRTQRTERQRQLYAPPPNLTQLMAPKPAAPPPVTDSAKPKISAPVPSGSFKKVSKEVDEARRKRREQLVRCESCVYATFAGAGVWFCPLPYCQTERRIERKEEPENVGDGTAGEPTAS